MNDITARRIMPSWEEAEQLFAAADPAFKKWSEGQYDAFERWDGKGLQRMLVFFPTGKGKTKMTLAALADRGHSHAIVIAPPRTHAAWRADAAVLGMQLRLDSHAKFRMVNTKYPADIPFIVDEFHLLGGHGAMGWMKFNRMAAHMRVEILMASATPNYNDAERVFCLTAIGDEAPNRNYMDWLWNTCNCHVSYFSKYPEIDEVHPFKGHDSAIAFLLDKDWVAYIEDDAVWQSDTMLMHNHVPPVFEEYGYNPREHRIIASDMEAYHKRVYLQYVDDDGFIRDDIMREFWVNVGLTDRRKWLVFCSHQPVAEALKRTMNKQGVVSYYIDGDTTDAQVEALKSAFIQVEGEAYLIGTATLATGIDGIDKACQSLLIFDDIRGDHSLRRQLIGRILPRGENDGIARLVITATF